MATNFSCFFTYIVKSLQLGRLLLKNNYEDTDGVMGSQGKIPRQFLGVDFFGG